MKNWGKGIQLAVAAAGKIKSVGKPTVLALAMGLLIIPWEGNELKPYLDIGGVPTACGGVTGPEITAAYHAGKVFTSEECELMTMAAAAVHETALRSLIADNIERDIPDLTMAAFVSWTYNVGAGNARTSTLIRLINQNHLMQACEQLPRWTRVKGKISRGLENRRFLGDAERLSERTVCLIGLDSTYRTTLFEKLIMKVK